MNKVKTSSFQQGNIPEVPVSIAVSIQSPQLVCTEVLECNGIGFTGCEHQSSVESICYIKHTVSRNIAQKRLSTVDWLR